MLLVTAKLNNNNTEFHWVVGGGGLEPIIESNQLYWLRLSWVLTILFLVWGFVCISCEIVIFPAENLCSSAGKKTA